MTLAAIFAALDTHIQAAEPAERSGLVVALAARLAALGGAGMADGAGLARRWIKLEVFAAGVGIDADDLRRWGRRDDATWMSAPSRKGLHVDPESFHRWMERKRPRRIRARSKVKAGIPDTEPSTFDTVAGHSSAKALRRG